MKWRYLLLVVIGLGIGLIIASYILGSFLSLPRQTTVVAPSKRVNIELTVIETLDGNQLFGWFLLGKPTQGGVLLLHSVRSHRGEMLDRALFLNDAGYSTLMVDFQAHGESKGDQITFGYRESYDVEASYRYLKNRVADRPIGIIGVSLGGAATLLSAVITSVDAFILESVYPTIDEAIANRLVIRLGPLGYYLTPLFTWQIEPRLGVSPKWLRPIDRIGQLQGPVMIIAGSEDRHTLLSESKRLYDSAPMPKEIWVIQGAAHENFYAYTPPEYKERVLGFFNRYLKDLDSNEF